MLLLLLLFINIIIDKIRQSTVDSLTVLKEEKEELIKRRDEMADYQNRLSTSMQDNVNQLLEERNLINNGQSMIHNMTGTIKDQLGIVY